MTEPDVIVDILKRIKAKVGLDEEVEHQVEADARRYWGGERCYIAKAGETPRRRAAHDRADRIRADHRRGDHIPLLARRYELSERHVRRILGILEAIDTQASNDDCRRRPLPTRKSRRRSRTDTTLP